MTAHLLSFLRQLLMAISPILGFCPAVHAADPATPEARPLFEDGSRWIAIGDSITHAGAYPYFLHLYLATRFPERNITMLNGGVSGDTAGGGVSRYDWDIAGQKPDCAMLMFGMNDVGRDHYAPGEADEARLQKRAACLASYRGNMNQLITRLKADGVRVILMTPTPFDDTAQLPADNLPGCNTGLAACADIVRELAREHDCALVNLHGPMTAMNLAGQKSDPAFTLSGPDRVHPESPGHLVATGLILRALGAPIGVSTIELDAAGLPRVTRSENAVVSDLERTPDGLAFTVLAKCLPFDAEDLPFPASNQLPPGLNREIVKIAGLAPGTYQLTIAGENILTCSAAELAAGIDLANAPDTPQRGQAWQVAALVKRWRERMDMGLRRIAQVEHYDFPGLPRPLSFEQTRGPVEAKLAAEENPYSWPAFVCKFYLEEKPREAETRAEIEQLVREIRQTARPVAIDYALKAL
jgi:lysophospholipase L1-like esterase